MNDDCGSEEHVVGNTLLSLTRGGGAYCKKGRVDRARNGRGGGKYRAIMRTEVL